MAGGGLNVKILRRGDVTGTASSFIRREHSTVGSAPSGLELSQLAFEWKDPVTPQRQEKLGARTAGKIRSKARSQASELVQLHCGEHFHFPTEVRRIGPQRQKQFLGNFDGNQSYADLFRSRREPPSLPRHPHIGDRHTRRPLDLAPRQ